MSGDGTQISRFGAALRACCERSARSAEHRKEWVCAGIRRAVRQPARVHVAGRTDDDDGVSMAAPMAWRRLGAERKLSGGGQCEPG
jgi:hypothetical protein